MLLPLQEFAGAVRIVKRVVAGAAAGGIASALCSPTDVVKIVAQRDTAAPIPVRHVAACVPGPWRTMLRWRVTFAFERLVHVAGCRLWWITCEKWPAAQVDQSDRSTRGLAPQSAEQ
eukprot:SAG31_NODE_645_length_13244_cov_11.768903_8_plen_117_part_00